VIISNAAREFVEMEVKETGIEEYFSHIFSATSDFKQVKKTSELYAQICKIIKITPSQMIHVGDHYEFDYLAPKELGIKTYFLDRNGTKPSNNFIVKNLKDFLEVFNQPFSEQVSGYYLTK
jgi:putative hydrolase of the HAD superfamily